MIISEQENDTYFFPHKFMCHPYAGAIIIFSVSFPNFSTYTAKASTMTIILNCSNQNRTHSTLYTNTGKTVL